MHFPLYLAEALLVELTAFVIPVARQVTFGLVSGVLIGTVGLAAEWGWSQVWMPLPWHSALWPLAGILGFIAAVAGGLLGGMMGRALLPPGAARQRTPRLVAPIAWAAALATIVIAMPMASHPDYKATVTLTQVDPAPQRSVMATVRLDPPQAADNATWFNLTSWQGGNGMFHSQIVGQWVVPMRKVSDGVYQSTRPVPVYGKWKTLLRLATVNSLQALPVYMPADPAIPAKAVDASPAVHPLVRRGQEGAAARGGRRLQHVAAHRLRAARSDRPGLGRGHRARHAPARPVRGKWQHGSAAVERLPQRCSAQAGQ